MKRKRVWGGPRPGAGRKPLIGPARRVLVPLPVEHVQALDELAREAGVSRCAVMRRAIAAYLRRHYGKKTT